MGKKISNESPKKELKLLPILVSGVENVNPLLHLVNKIVIEVLNKEHVRI